MVTQVQDKDTIRFIVEKQKNFFNSGATLPLNFRIKQLKKLFKAVSEAEKDICDAMHKDFRKSPVEVYGTEISLVLKETKYFLRNLPKLMRPERVRSSLASFPARTYIYHEPFGQSLIIGPWNYPLMLMLQPLAGAIAAGNCVIMKPSELASNTSALIAKLIKDNFDDSYISVLEGGPTITQQLLIHKFDVIFFTGSERVGKIVYEAAAKTLTPCILELGGKSPCIVDEDANIDLAARRISWGKLVNGGQSCVAPDYLFVHRKVKDKLLSKMQTNVTKYFGENIEESEDLTLIINDAHFSRLQNYLSDGTIVFGGKSNSDKRYIEPTLLDNVSWDDRVMKEEIFGPILPVLTFDNLDDVITKINEQPKPLALYYFSTKKRKQDKILNTISFGGGCINDTMLQFASPSIPVGGVGPSGMGSYHGKQSFIAFSNAIGIVKKSNIIDVPLRYPPYKGKYGLIKWILNL